MLMGSLALSACPGEEPTGPPAVTSVEVSPASATFVSLGETVQFSASARDASGSTIADKTFTWTSSAETVATVNTSGLVTAVANGSATIQASTDGVSGTATILVQQVAT